ncbi:riboflavin synthase [Chondromyces crocatus]|uniref:Riboflavin synthase n=1 Tax=Chondromyces crocatus TaxID=52 RepID=A0A0K1ERW7_CHOCO|nr:riboflavin synthase [Chondromyces crocatus]AKT43402.1 riboflavin synthase subunit alpha [Chondromyces crocatus]
MFTGLVETIGVLRRRAGAPLARALIEGQLGVLVLGDSISVNGACLTVDRITPGGFECDMSPETLERTTLGRLPLGARVHLEPATPLGGRMGGHVVLGHVDGIGRVTATERAGAALRLEVSAPAELARFIAQKGSIAIDGASLTVNAAGEPRGSSFTFDVMLVPHTLGKTLLGELKPGSAVNLEVDVLARYVARQLEVVALQGRSVPTHEGREEADEHVDPDQRILQKLRAAGFA